MIAPRTLTDAALGVLTASDPADKMRLTAAARTDRGAGRLADLGGAVPVDRPGRPKLPPLLPPRDMPKRRRAGSAAGRIALLHALAHIELNAIDLAWDMIARFADPARAGLALPAAFFDDWLSVAADEARHFGLLAARLEALGSAYGALPAHDGLWQAAADTGHDLAARLAVVPLVLEARGLDVTPPMIAGFRRTGDHASAAILQTIHDDEIGHVAIGRIWFEHVCAAREVGPVVTWQHLVRTHFHGVLKKPFNRVSRDLAGFHAAFYEPLGV
ncbi:MAG: ferritin-like domain-containing protein [Inquilinaceae bacterium]